MVTSAYANVGFRCESVCIALKEYKKSRKINQFILEDSKRILSDCLRIENDEKHSLFLSKPIEYDSEAILFDYIKEKNDKDVLEKLKRIYTNVNKLESLNMAEIKEVDEFFCDIVSLCKDKTQIVINNDSYMIFGIM